MRDLLMPKLGLTMTEGSLVEWCVNPGDAFNCGDLLFVVETEKVTNEITAEEDGVLAEILVAEGDTVEVGTAVARLRESTDDTLQQSLESVPAAKLSGALSASNEKSKSRVEVPSEKRVQSQRSDDRIVATPYARKLAARQGVNLGEVTGTGAGGRIKGRDIAGAGEINIEGAQIVSPDAGRLATARIVTAAKREIPHYYLSQQVEVSKLENFRQAYNAENSGSRVSVTHLLVRAIGLALEHFPGMKRIWQADKILQFRNSNVGIVVETDDGLRTVVLRDVAQSETPAIAEQAREQIARARGNKLLPADVGDAVIAISNVGMFGVASLAPIIHPANSMIVGVGAMQSLFRPDSNGQPELRREMTLVLACDHRVIDGADGARFLAFVVSLLENPDQLNQ